MHDSQKSDPCIVAMKSSNNAEGAAAEGMERRRGAQGNLRRPATRWTQCQISVYQGLERVRERAKRRKQERFTALLHHVDVDRLRAAYFRLERDAAAGV